MRDMRLTWRARGILAELATGYPPGQEPKIGDLVSLNRDQRVAAEGRAAFSKAVGELRAVGYLVLATTRASGVGERLVVDLTQAADARMISEVAGWSSYTDGS